MFRYIKGKDVEDNINQTLQYIWKSMFNMVFKVFNTQM